MEKEELRAIAKNGFAIPDGSEAYAVIREVIDLLASPDPELRDELAYGALYHWLLLDELLQGPQLEELLRLAISEDMLFSGIGEEGTDSVFLRTFSSLLIALLLARDNREAIFARETYDFTLDALVRYCLSERDFRGYVEVKGWAHAAAHCADALDECAASRYAGMEECERIWTGLRALLDRAPQVYQAEEDERIATAVFTMIHSGNVTLAQVCEWAKALNTLPSKELSDRYRTTNGKHFIRSLFMRLQTDEYRSQAEQLLELEEDFNRFRQ
ncbi:DUF2785 domain-containing protein [Gorillibacterium timonense]|uniref:DUF2785 domain-containing protein n=1 Tax=Gorillibacterium timonense TaxID=1689269 RepID=UPI00071E0247|nr:DUF2785 domain-containing protein [Gorillibacterium timonense]